MKGRVLLIAGVVFVALALAALTLAVTASAATRASPSLSAWTDDFDAPALKSIWAWAHQDATRWSLSERPGWLKLTSQVGALELGENWNMLAANAPAGDFTIETRLLFTPTENIQRAGLVIQQSPGNHVALLRAFCGFPPDCVGNGIYLDHAAGGQLIGSNFAITGTLPGEVFLRLMRAGDVYTGFMSADGASWTLVGSHVVTTTLPPARIALMADEVGLGGSEIPAYFDYFKLEDSSQKLFLPSLASANYLCDDPIGCLVLPPGEPIHLAYALVITGPNASLGIDSRNGVEIAISDTVQVLGRAITLTGVDDGCSPDGGLAAGTLLAADPSIAAVVGTSCSSAARSAVPLLSQAGFTIVSPSNTAVDLTEPGNPNNHPGYLRTVPPDSLQGQTAAQYAWEVLGAQTAATISDGSGYAEGLILAFLNHFVALGGQIVEQETIDAGGTVFSTTLITVAASAPDVVYLPIFMPAAGYLIPEARTTPGLETVAMISADALNTPDLVAQAGAAVNGLYVTSPLLPSGPAYDAFLAKYQAKFGYAPTSIYHPNAYDATLMLLAAIEEVAVQGADGRLHIPRQALRQAMYASKDFAGLTGTLTCSPYGDCATPLVAVYQYGGGVYPPVQVWP